MATTPRKQPPASAGQESQSDQPLPASDAERRARIAEAAYYNAERRGFQGGYETEDWLEAERQVDSHAAGKGIQAEASRMAEGADDVSAPNIRQERQPDAADGIIEPDQLKQWARDLNVTAARLREAIKTVGPRVEDVRQFLGTSPAKERSASSQRAKRT
jgi:hypothetical protein